MKGASGHGMGGGRAHKTERPNWMYTSIASRKGSSGAPSRGMHRRLEDGAQLPGHYRAGRLRLDCPAALPLSGICQAPSRQPFEPGIPRIARAVPSRLRHRALLLHGCMRRESGSAAATARRRRIQRPWI